MAELFDVFGNNYREETSQAKTTHVINTIANNVAHRQFHFRVFDLEVIWTPQSNLPEAVISALKQKVKAINKHLHLFRIDKQSEQLNLLPELIVDSPVEYFMIIDAEFNRTYFLYITPYEVSPY